MNSCLYARSLVLLAVFGGTLGGSLDAQADSCHVNDDCDEGFECLHSPEGSPEGHCDWPSCQHDADCDEGLRCARVGTVCRESDDGGLVCDKAMACVAQWQVPCREDSDCGPGFTCSGKTVYFDCRDDAEAQVPPGATVSHVPCEAVPKPPQISGCDDAGVDSRTVCKQRSEICKPGADWRWPARYRVRADRGARAFASRPRGASSSLRSPRPSGASRITHRRYPRDPVRAATPTRRLTSARAASPIGNATKWHADRCRCVIDGEDARRARREVGIRPGSNARERRADCDLQGRGR